MHIAGTAYAHNQHLFCECNPRKVAAYWHKTGVTMKSKTNTPVTATLEARANARTDGQQHTLNHFECPVCIEANMLLVEIDSDFSLLPFTRVRELWMVLRKRSYLKPRTHEATEGHLGALERFFGSMRLCDINAGHLRSYQTARTANRLEVNGEVIRPWYSPAGNSLVNHELSALAQILTHCKLWPKLDPYYFPLPVRGWSPREVLSEEDEEKFFKAAAEHPEASLAYWVATITNNTTAAGMELRHLRLKNLFLRDKKEISEIYIPEDAVKNNSRPRKISLNPEARWAIEQCHRRALSLGAYDPDHYLFPFRVKSNDYDPKRPAGRTFLRKSWERLRTVTGFPDVNPHDLRHQCITRLLENDVQPETVRAIAGHVTEKMMQYYSHQRRATKYAAVMAICSRKDKNKKEAKELRRKSA